jgi:hypothetical protein
MATGVSRLSMLRRAGGPTLASPLTLLGGIVAEARVRDLATPQQDYDWFGQCTTPAVDTSFSLYPAGGDAGPLATQVTNAQGRAHFGELSPGTYSLRPDGTT